MGLLLLFLLGFGTELAASEKVYELVGRVVPATGVSLRGQSVMASIQSISLQNMKLPYSSRSLVDGKGDFKFKRLSAGMYTLTISVPRTGSLRRTVDIGPSFADEKGRIVTTFVYERRLRLGTSYSVPSTQLAIPESARKEFRKAIEHLQKGEGEKAKECLLRAVELAPNFSGAWNRLGLIAYQQNDYARAEECYREALQHNPDSYGPLINLGGVLLAAGKGQEAVDVNRRAVESRPDDPLAHAQLGYAYASVGQVEKGVVSFKKAKELDLGHFSFPQLALAEVYRRRQEWSAMIAELEEFLKLHPDFERAPEIRKWLEEIRTPPTSSLRPQ